MKKLRKFINDIFYLNDLKKIKDEEKVIYMLTPRYGNLGDQMISVAIEKILSDIFVGKKVFEIEEEVYLKRKEEIKKYINKKDVIILQGGGNIGDVWLGAEQIRRSVLEKYSDNKIIIMPQTITFKSEEEKKRSADIYSKVKDLSIITREEYSYRIAKEIFKNSKIYLTPDSVLYLEDYFNERFNDKREGVLFLLRKDHEKTISSNISKNIEVILKKLDLSYDFSDTVIRSKGKINKKTRINFCKKLIEEISSKKLIITDRLHGMILSVITNTPVIVFGSSTKKTIGSLKWIEHLDYVSFIKDENDIEHLEKEIKRLQSIKIVKKDNLIKELMKKEFIKIFEEKKCKD